MPAVHSVETREHRAVLHVVGELDIATVRGVVRTAVQTLDAYEEVDLDLGHVSFIDCAGMHGVEAILNAAGTRGRRIRIRTSPAVDRLRRLLKTAGIGEWAVQSMAAPSSPHDHGTWQDRPRRMPSPSEHERRRPFEPVAE